jgi:hypothetical protein
MNEVTMTPDSVAQHPLDPIFEKFEKDTGWTLSPQAKNILREGYASVEIDTLGLGDFAQSHLRSVAIATVLNKMPKFLEALKHRAKNREDNTDKQVIGGVFVLQNTGEWKSLFNCTCWPV